MSTIDDLVTRWMPNEEQPCVFTADNPPSPEVIRQVLASLDTAIAGLAAAAAVLESFDSCIKGDLDMLNPVRARHGALIGLLILQADDIKGVKQELQQLLKRPA